MRPSRLRILILLAVLGAAPRAGAEGPGIRLGDRLVMHLGLAAQFSYDSNVFFQNSGQTGAFLFSLIPSVDLGTRSSGTPHTVDFRLHAGMDYNEFLTGNKDVERHRSFGVQAGALLTLLPGHKFTIDLLDNFVRMSQPPYNTAQASNIDRDVNQVGLRLHFKPGGGRLQLTLAYLFGIDYFENPEYRDLDVQYHFIQARLSWKFFPKTALYLEATESPYIYPHPGSTAHPNSFPLRVVLGVQGLITPKLTAHVFVGYGNGFYQYAATAMSTPSPNTGVAGLDIRWKPFYSSSLGLGYNHDFANSLLGSYYDVDKAYLNYAQGLWRFTGFLELAYSNIRYQGIQMNSSVAPPSRTDNLLMFNVRLDYPFKSWLTLSAGYTLTYNNSSSKLDLGPLGLLPVDYLKHVVWLRLAVLY